MICMIINTLEFPRYRFNNFYLLPTAECRSPLAQNHIDPPIQLPSNPRYCNLVSKFPGTEMKKESTN